VRTIAIENIFSVSVRISYREHYSTPVPAEQKLILMYVIQAQLFTELGKSGSIMGYIEYFIGRLFYHPLETYFISGIKNHGVVVIYRLGYMVFLKIGTLSVPKIYFVTQFLEKKEKNITHLLNAGSRSRIMI
jgi:hypothetical protein